MGKVTTTNPTSNPPSIPDFSNGSFSINNSPVATTQKQGNQVVSNYNQSPYEQFINQYAQQSFADSLPKINTFLPETLEGFGKQMQAYQSKGISDINNVYNPMLKNLQNDVATRFGNLDNSMFMDNLNGIESKRGEAINLFAQDMQSKQSQLVNEELQRRYNYLSLLMDVQNQQFDKILKSIGISQNNTSLGNQQNQNAYQAQYRQYLDNQGAETNKAWQQALNLALSSTMPQLAPGKSFLGW